MKTGMVAAVVEMLPSIRIPTQAMGQSNLIQPTQSRQEDDLRWETSRRLDWRNLPRLADQAIQESGTDLGARGEWITVS